MTTDINDVVREKLGIAPAKGGKPRKRKPTVADQRQEQLNKVIEQLDEAATLADELQGSFETALNELRAKFEDDFEALSAKLSEATQGLDAFKSEIEEKRDALEEKFSGTERYSALSELYDALDSISIPRPYESFGKSFDFGEALEAITEATSEIEWAKSELEGVEIG